ncbi:MAG: FG-GAP repeat protein [Gammaproteobacteria bacterium]|nr:FG-GAP repeat protein [Gammaproteobacteria bacterium]MCP5459993.1 FG-GAP repeat protein [Gammaproteobacteria bacterium]
MKHPVAFTLCLIFAVTFAVEAVAGKQPVFSEQQKLTDPSAAPSDLYGFSVALSEPCLAVGAKSVAGRGWFGRRGRGFRLSA